MSYARATTKKQFEVRSLKSTLEVLRKFRGYFEASCRGLTQSSYLPRTLSSVRKNLNWTIYLKFKIWAITVKHWIKYSHLALSSRINHFHYLFTKTINTSSDIVRKCQLVVIINTFLWGLFNETTLVKIKKLKTHDNFIWKNFYFSILYLLIVLWSVLRRANERGRNIIACTKQSDSLKVNNWIEVKKMKGKVYVAWL